MTLGNSDFNYGEKNIKSLEMRANFKILAANLKKQNGQDYVTPYIIKNIRGVKVGIFGLVSPDIYNNENAFLDTLTVDEPILAATKTVKELKSQGAEFIIALTNLGMNTDTNREWQSSAVAESVSGIDLIIDGNSKTPLEEKIMINDTVIVQTGENLKNIGVLKIDFDAPKRDTNRIFYKLIKKEDIVMIDDAPAAETPKQETASAEKVLKIDFDAPKRDTNRIFYKLIKKEDIVMIDDAPAAETPKQETASAEKFTTHTVVKGDTLYSLAKRYNTTVAEIVALNPTIEDGKTISIGQTYIMTSNKSPLAEKNLPNLKNGEKYIEHKVVKGDTLYSLSKKYGTTVDAVVAKIQHNCS